VNARSRGPEPHHLPADLTGMTDAQVRELAEAYIDLLRLMSGALHDCSHGYGFFSWSGRGYDITGHPPIELLRAIEEAGR